MSNESALALLIITAPVVAVTAFLEHRRKQRLPDTRPFTWGYLWGVGNLVIGALGLAGLLASPFFESVKKGNNDAIFGSLLILCFYGIPGFFVLKRRAWAWVFSTICCCNPIAWLINYRYGKNRWEEFRRERSAPARWVDALAVLVCVVPVFLALVLSEHHHEPGSSASAGAGVQAAPQANPATPSRTLKEGPMPSSNLAASRDTSRASVDEGTKKAHPHVIGGTVIPYHITFAADWTNEGKQKDYDFLCNYKDTLWLGVIAEEAELETSSLADIAIANMRKACSIEPAVSDSGWTLIDGRNWRTFRVDTRIDGSKFTFQYYLYGGPEGTFQIIGWTTSNIFPKYREDLDAVARTFSFPAKCALQGSLEALRAKAERGNVAAQCELAFSYYTGDGVPQDSGEAVKWFRKAADQGKADAQCYLGLCYDIARGVPKDKAEAAKWYRKAADQGNAMAQRNLGFFYYEGDGVPKDYVQAYKWASLASAQGEVWSEDLLTKLGSLMTPAQISEAQRLSREFTPRTQSAGAAVPTFTHARADSSPSACGSGFFITEDGFFITCEHVIKNAKEVRLLTRSGLIRATVVKTDAANDLALLKAKGRFTPLPLTGSHKVHLGDSVVTVGFPNVGLQGFSPKLAKGEIASLSGIQDAPKYFQVSVPLQPGNSGGALVDERGNVVAVVAAKLDAAVALSASGALPENVNYAIKSSFLLSFLEASPEVLAKVKDPNTNDRPFQDVVKSAEDAAVLVLAY